MQTTNLLAFLVSLGEWAQAHQGLVLLLCGVMPAYWSVVLVMQCLRRKGPRL